MVESIMFVGMSIVISIVPEKKKNFNKLCLLGAGLYTVSMFCEGPVIGLPVSRSIGIYWIGLGIAIGGVGGAMIMPAAMPALDESLRNCFPPGKDAQVKNAMGALIAGAFGTGNFIGTIVGSVLNQVFETKDCLPQPPMSSTYFGQEAMIAKDSKFCNIDYLWKNYGKGKVVGFNTKGLSKLEIRPKCFRTCDTHDKLTDIFLPVNFDGW